MRRFFVVFVMCLACLVFATVAPADDSNWSKRFCPPGVYNGEFVGTVNAIGMDDGVIYIGGAFDRVGLVPANNIARYDHGQWEALDEGVEGAVSDMLVLDRSVYVTCYHRNSEDQLVNGVSHWDGHWSVIGDDEFGNGDFDGGVFCLAYQPGALYAGGSFYNVGTANTGTVAKWDGSVWASAGTNTLVYAGWPFAAVVYDLDFMGGSLWAGGDFTYATPYDTRYIAVMDEDEWLPAGDVGFDDKVTCMTTGTTTAYIGGRFSMVDNQSSPLLAKAYSNNNLAPLGGSAPDHYVNALLKQEHSVLVATELSLRDYGQFGWSTPYDSMRRVFCMHENYTDLWVGGELLGPDSYCDAVALWHSGHWYRLGGGLAYTADARDHINAFCTYDGDLVAGGYLFIDSVSEEVPDCSNIGIYDGTGWLPLGHGFTDEVNAVIAWGGYLIAGGHFDHSGPDPVAKIAYWADDTWAQMGSGANGDVNCLLDYGGDLIVGGEFTELVGTTVGRIGRWDGTSWYDLAGGADGGIVALATDGDNLYAAGSFQNIGGVAAANIARWDGTQWHAMAEGCGTSPQVLYWWGESLWVGRSEGALGSEVTVLRRWDGDSWHDVGAFLSSESITEVRSMLGTSAGLVIGGSFNTVDGQLVNHTAIWDGDQWLNFGTGFSGGWARTGVYALQVINDRLYFGGDFTHAGTTLSCNVARWDDTITPVYLADLDARVMAATGGPQVVIDWRARGQDGPVEFQLTAHRQAETWPVAVETVADGRWSATDSDPRLISGGEVTYCLSGRESGETWQELGQKTVIVPVVAPTVRLHLSVAPNPANPRTEVKLWSPRAAETTVTVHDVRGAEVARLFSGALPAGDTVLTWDGCDRSGRDLASGIYLVRAVTDADVTSARVALVR